MVFLQSVNVAIRVDPLYRTAVRHIQTFVRVVAERGNWLSVRVAGAPRYQLETPRSRSSNLVEWFNDQITWTTAEDPSLTKGSKNLLFEKACNCLWESLHPSSF